MLSYTEIYRRYIDYAKGKRYSIILDIILTPCSWITGLIMAAADFLYSHGLIRSNEPPLPVISVGNLTYGGTNKTPFTIMLAEHALKCGIKPGIVTRGYMGKAQDVIIILDGNAERDIAGDEAVMISRKLPGVPVAVSKRRIDGVNALSEMGVELVIADDAFQHRAMSRDCDIVLVDALCPFGNGRLTPAGIMREKVSALSRANIAVITKSSMASPYQLNAVYYSVSKHIPAENIFMSEISSDGWMFTEPEKGANVFAFSATGSPETFVRSLSERGCIVSGSASFRDHHRYTHDDILSLNECAIKSNAVYIACTEKDIANMDGISPSEFALPLCVPKVKVTVSSNKGGGGERAFFSCLADVMRPNIVIASNGYGEDAVAAVLAEKIREAFPHSSVSAFPLVGKGSAFVKAGITVMSAKSVTPSAGILKYSLRELWGDIRAGLPSQVREQLRDWRKVSNRILPPICVGDVYLLANALWGCGKRSVFVATAKTVYISGHWRTERMIIRRFALRTWTRDEPTASQIGAGAVYAGSPIMSLSRTEGDFTGSARSGNVVLLLPGSRKSAGINAGILLRAAEIMSLHGYHHFRMALASTLDYGTFLDECDSYGWHFTRDGILTKRGICASVSLTSEDISSAAEGVQILLGMGGTANQLCAGMGIPVIAPDDKGKRVQKLLLGDGEILTQNTPGALAACAMTVMSDTQLYRHMSEAGRNRMGHPSAGICHDVVRYTREILGWGIRENVYMRLKHFPQKA